MLFPLKAVQDGVLLPVKLYVIAVGAGPNAFIINSAWTPNLLSTGVYEIGAAVVQPIKKDDRLWAKANYNLRDRFAGYSITEQIEFALAEGVSPKDLVVCICTPTHLHAQHICEAVNAGATNIICDKPLVTSLAELREIQELLKTREDVQIYVTFNHIFNGPVFQMRAIVAEAPDNVDCLGGAFLQDWLTKEIFGQQADWRVADPLCGLFDIGTHALQLASFVAGSPIKSVVNAEINRKGPFARTKGFSDQGDAMISFFHGQFKAHVEYDQARPGHADDIYVSLTMKDGVRYLWRMAWGPDTLFVSRFRGASVDRPDDWVAHYRGHSSIFSPKINALFGDTPGGHIQGWPQLWKSLFEGIAIDIWRRNEHPILKHLPEERTQLPLPTIVMTGENITATVAAWVASAEKNGAEVFTNEILRPPV